MTTLTMNEAIKELSLRKDNAGRWMPTVNTPEYVVLCICNHTENQAKLGPCLISRLCKLKNSIKFIKKTVKKLPARARTLTFTFTFTFIKIINRGTV